MPRLIVLNGPPGVGKSTLAHRYLADHSLALNLDLDLIRRLLGRWDDSAETAEAAGLATRAIALAAAETHLRAGYDVVIPQLIARPPFLEQLDALVARLNAEVENPASPTDPVDPGRRVEMVEVVLWDSLDGSRARFAHRTATSADSGHAEAARLLEQLGGDAEFDAIHRRLGALIETRPQAVVVPSEAGRIEQTYRAVTAVCEGGRPR